MFRTKGVHDHHSIETSKLMSVWIIVQSQQPDLSFREMQEFVLADWPQGDEHQNWLDNASVQEIADWVITSLHNQ